MHNAMQLEIHEAAGRDVPESAWRHSESEASHQDVEDCVASTHTVLTGVVRSWGRSE